MFKKYILLTLLMCTFSLTAFAKPNYSYTINETPAPFFNLGVVYVANKVAQNIEKSAYNSVLTFPAKSKREIMVVSQHLALGFVPEGWVYSHKPSDFNDIEKVK